jgi:hypothetical protein
MKHETVSDEGAFGQATARSAQRLEISALLESISQLLEVYGMRASWVNPMKFAAQYA